MSRLGIFGGTFNPPHIGHKRLAEHFVNELMLDRLLVIPTFQPPHKAAQSLASGEDRVNMCLLNFPDAVVSTLELERGGKSYTIDTLHEIKAQYPDDELFLIVGSDMLLSFDRWYKYDEILSLCTLCAADRQEENSILKQCGVPKCFNESNLRLTSLEPFEVSSTEIRALIKDNKPTDGLLDEAVRFYIEDKGLYK